MKLVSFFAVFLLALPGGAAPKMSREEFMSRLSEGLDTVEQAIADKPKHKLVLSGNLFFAHGAAVKYFTAEVLKRYAEGLRRAGATRIDINPSVQPFVNDDRETLAK